MSNKKYHKSWIPFFLVFTLVSEECYSSLLVPYYPKSTQSPLELGPNVLTNSPEDRKPFYRTPTTTRPSWASTQRMTLPLTVITAKITTPTPWTTTTTRPQILPPTIETPKVAFSCRKMMMRMAKRQLKAYSACNLEMSKDIPCKTERAEKFGCITKCTMGKQYMLNQNGTLTHDSFGGFLDAYVPEHFHDMTRVFVDPCIDNFLENEDPLDEYCKNFGNFMACVQESVSGLMDICT